MAAHFGQMDFVREILTKMSATIRSEIPKTAIEGLPSKEQPSEVIKVVTLTSYGLADYEQQAKPQ